MTIDNKNIIIIRIMYLIVNNEYYYNKSDKYKKIF